MPDKPVVKTAAICTLALATAGDDPVDKRKDVAEIPYAIPRAPSITWAKNPMTNAFQNSGVTKISSNVEKEFVPFD
tara:strand:+ start:1451 stop:1678 length:228 start_codon:yes stop_codon:yes gene_type:complete